MTANDESDGMFVGILIVIPLMIAMFLFVAASLDAYLTGKAWNIFTVVGLVFYSFYGAMIGLIAYGGKNDERDE